MSKNDEKRKNERMGTVLKLLNKDGAWEKTKCRGVAGFR